MRLPAVLLLLLAFVCIATGGCMREKQDTELSRYVTEILPRLRSIERGALAEYEKVSGERYEDDAALFDALRMVVVPALTGLISTAEIARPEMDALRHLHASYVAVLEKELSAFQLYVVSLDQQDADGQQRAIDQLRDVKELMGAFERRLKEFCAERGVTMPPSAQES